MLLLVLSFAFVAVVVSRVLCRASTSDVSDGVSGIGWLSRTRGGVVAGHAKTAAAKRVTLRRGCEVKGDDVGREAEAKAQAQTCWL